MRKIIFIFLCCLGLSNLFANETYSKKDIEKMIAKMVILGFNGEKVSSKDEIYQNVKAGLGGVILFDKDPNDKNKVKNVRNKEQLKTLTSQLQAISNQKLLIGIDQEGGIVQRLKSNDGFVNTPKASEVALKGENFAKQTYKNLAVDLSESGINLDFAPVVDLAINKNNKVIEKRTSYICSKTFSRSWFIFR
jgi:beta-N-acetylhexosaminidase